MTEEGWIKYDLPVGVDNHCMVLINTSTAMLIGGSTEDAYFSGKTYFYNFADDIWTEGPNLIKGRLAHSCAMVKKDKDSDEVK